MSKLFCARTRTKPLTYFWRGTTWQSERFSQSVSVPCQNSERLEHQNYAILEFLQHRGPHIECMITTTKLPVHNGYHAKLWSTVHMSSKSKITTRICQHIFMLRSIQLMNTWLRVHERWNSVPLTSWPQAVNSSRVHATRVLHFVIKDSGSWW